MPPYHPAALLYNSNLEKLTSQELEKKFNPLSLKVRIAKKNNTITYEYQKKKNNKHTKEV